MHRRSSGFRNASTLAIGAGLFSLIFLLLAPSLTYAGNTETVLPNVPVYGPCPPASQCRFYEEMNKVLGTTEGVVVMALVMAALNALTYMTQQLAEATAQFIIHGGKGGLAQYYPKTFGGFLEDVGTAAANSFITDMNQYVKQATGFNICAPFGLQALDIQLSLGLEKKLWPQKKIDCSFRQFTKNFETSVQSLESAEAFKFVKANLRSDRSELGAAVTYQQQALIRERKALDAQTLDRLEGRGIRPVAHQITGNIRTPAQEVQNTLAETNRVKLNNDTSKLTVGTIAANAFKIGIYQLPVIFGATFLNTLASAGLSALKSALLGGAGKDEIQKAQLLNPFAQAGADKPPRRAVAFHDIVTPNLLTTDAQDFVHELSSCSTPRGLWNCAMDDTFAAGLRAFDQNGAFSVARAMGIGTDGKGFVFLRPDWELIPESETKDNQDPGCYQRAYCASNLAKLRFARILPIGWELAANSPFNVKKNGRYVTLGEVVRGFTVCDDANPVADKDHPWCHLIDPSWVLSAPPFKCQVKGFGDSVFPGQIPIRQQECSDVISCLARNDKGQCVGGYGYCLSEKTVWRFNADACLERYVSCRTYEKRNKAQIPGNAIAADTFGGESVSYIRNTIDYGSCNADNVGCMYYATTRDTKTTSTDAWIGSIAPWQFGTKTKATTGPILSGPRAYFDATIEPCDAANEGCTKLLKIQDGASSLNLIKNGSFEATRSEDASKFDTWQIRPGTTPVTVGSIGFLGSRALEAKFPSGAFQRVALAPLRSYVVSYYAKKASGDSFPLASLTLKLLKSDGATPVSEGTLFYRNKETCSSGTSAKQIQLDGSDLNEAWKRFTCEFVSNTDAVVGELEVGGLNVLFDGVQLEEGDRATAFIDGESGTLSADYLRLAPEELACSGDAKKDRNECSKYARMCMQFEAGCQGYTDSSSADTTEIPATLRATDFCPSACVGYAEYRKLPSAFDLVKNTEEPLLDDPEDDSLAYFVPSNADQCTAQQVGCEEFTNIETASAGGEQKAAFNYARACQKPGDLSTTYFTWEGSETTGYQLRTWSLIRESSVSPAPPKLLLKAGPEGLIKKPETCTEKTWKAGVDPDCRQFYDEKGNVFYRYFSQTVVSSPECRNYRKNNSDFADCDKTGGAFNKTTNACVYSILAAQSASCPVASTGCRGYIGTTGRNTAVVLQERFVSSTSTGAFKATSGIEISVSTEALTVGDHSLKVVRASGGPKALSFSLGYTAATGSLYTLSFWAKTTDASRATVAVTIDGKIVGTFTPLIEWSRFEIGPFTADKLPFSVIEWRNVPHVSFFDEFKLIRQQDVVYVRKGSWKVPAICDQTSAGIPQPQAMLGCRAYRDRRGDTKTVRQFSRLCRFDSIGCTAYIDTRNSPDPYAQSFPLAGYDATKLTKPWDSLYSGIVTVTRPADRFVYVIDEPRSRCDASMASCRAFGKPTFKPDWMLATSTPFETVYLKDDVTKYADASGEPKMLCRPNELFCERYGSQTPTGPVTSYFRDPGDHACEWRDKVALSAGATYPKGEYSGWFVKGVDPAIPCYPEKVSSGNAFLAEFSAAFNYRGWTGMCPEDQAECTEFRDPHDNTDASHPQGRPYFFLNNQKIDRQTCNGQVDLLSGCVLFRDMTDSQLPFSTIATYAKSAAESGNAQSPINCTVDPKNPFCKGKCGEFKRAGKQRLLGTDSLEFVKKRTNALCSTDVDCSIRYEGDLSTLDDDYNVSGVCLKNDANTIVKVKLDRDCATWLGCSSGETVYDSSQGKYVDLCTNLSVCDQGLGPNGKQFCAHYLDRSTDAATVPIATTLYEPLLREGAFVSASSYSKRPVGFAKPDYAGYVLPNHFQISDFVTRRVGYEILANRPGPLRDRYYSDYRIVARTPLYVGTPNGAGGIDTIAGDRKQESPYGAIRFTDPKFPFLRLCQHKQTKQIGYYLAATKTSNPAPIEKPAFCYFAIDVPYTQNPADLGGDGSTNPRNIQNLYVYLEQARDAHLNSQLTRAFPSPDCKAHPDASSPFPNVYVQEWDVVADPPKPKKFVEGYDNAPYCEYGEDCACVYRKVSYGARAKHYSPYGQSPPSGICVGGSRDGQACVPDSEIAGPSTVTIGGVTTTLNSPGAQESCGAGGACQAIDTVNLIRGMFGQCLQRDESRRRSGLQSESACLVWNPAPLLYGKNDAYHYQPTAGYVPPSNSGEYYCVANALPPKSIQMPASRDWFQSPGQMEDHKFYYSTEFVQEEKCVVGFLGLGCHGNEAPFIDGARANGGAMGNWCGQQGNSWLKRFFGSSGSASDPSAGRWIMTGRGADHSYAEYFIGLKHKAWGRWLKGIGSSCDENDLTNCKDRAVLDSLLERNFSFFSWSPVNNPSAMVNCGYSEVWVDGGAPGANEDKEKVRAADGIWKQRFLSAFPKIMSRDSQNYLRTADGSKLLKVPCFYADDNPDGSGCYYKFWELGYRDSAEEKFQMQFDDHGGPRKFDKNSIYYQESQASKPFFSIRAMFEDTNRNDNAQEPGDGKDEQPASGNKLTGPFRFVGWWITASAPGTDTEHAIYMSLTVGHANICMEVAQVVSPDTREATVFQDRVWQSSAYSVPGLGYINSSVNEPFGSAKHMRPIGGDPLFQVRGPLPGVRSKLKPPTFISAGLEYAKAGTVPTANWAWLTNLFARVYRVYRFYDQPVTKDSWACIAGPRFGNWCPDLSEKTSFIEGKGLDYTGEALTMSRTYCGYVGTCTGQIDVSKSLGLCNALSGVNAGLSCSSDTVDPIGGYHVCHNAPMQDQGNGVLKPLYKACTVAKGWKKVGSLWSSCSDPVKCPPISKKEAAKDHAFVCEQGSVTIPSLSVPGAFAIADCNDPRPESPECPQEVLGLPSDKISGYPGSIASQCVAGRCNNGFGHAACHADADCEFTYTQWWGSYNAEKKPSPPAVASMGSGIEVRGTYGLTFGVERPLIPWWSSNPTSFYTKQFNPGTGDAEYAKVISGKPSDKPWLDIGGKDLFGSAWVKAPLARVERFPGAYAASFDEKNPAFIPGHCEKAPEDTAALKNFIESICPASGTKYSWLCAKYADRPYAERSYYAALAEGKIVEGGGYFPDGFKRYFGDAKQPWKQASCEGGAFEGRACSSDAECAPQTAELAKFQEDAGYYCQPVVTPYPTVFGVGAPNQNTVTGRFSFSCVDPKGDPKSENLDTDENLCTHNAGYYPRVDLCGNDPTRPQCLTAITQNDAASIDPTKAASLPPTDVTPGLYTPRYLATKLKDEYKTTEPDPKKFSDTTYKYISYYAPRPPTVAAPDTTRQCPSAGSCPIAQLNAFTFENQTEGLVSAVGGASIATIRFYGWAADNQAPLKDVWIDWGDSLRQEFHDAQIKNKKPFCGGMNECQLVPGLTCNTDADCPPAGGKCAPVGFCKTRANVQCQTDDDCAFGITKDTCVTRTTFGSSAQDCEQNFFEFTHAYACGSEARRTLTKCETTSGAIKRCSQNNDVICATDSECGVAGKCVDGRAPPGGCFDEKKAACRFTPRVILKDAWGWCTGECRVQTVGGKPSPGFKSTVKPGAANTILLANGGCYDGSKAYQNTDTNKPFVAQTGFSGVSSSNLCDPSSTDAWHSPWVVYQGALQLGVLQ